MAFFKFTVRFASSTIYHHWDNFYFEIHKVFEQRGDYIIKHLYIENSTVCFFFVFNSDKLTDLQIFYSLEQKNRVDVKICFRKCPVKNIVLLIYLTIKWCRSSDDLSLYLLNFWIPYDRSPMTIHHLIITLCFIPNVTTM